eukprot:6176952-Pleurochrysis_carterae.AAC.3
MSFAKTLAAVRTLAMEPVLASTAHLSSLVVLLPVRPAVRVRTFSMPLQSNALLQPFNKRQLRVAQHRWIMQLSQNDVLQRNSSEYALNLLAVRCLSNLFGAIWHLVAVCVRRDSWFRSTLSLARQNQTSRL